MAAWLGMAERGLTWARAVLAVLPRPNQLTVGQGSAHLLLNSEPRSA